MPISGTYDYGCMMIILAINPEFWNKFTSKLIKPEDIFDGDDYGIEDEPHLTILYGLHADTFNLLNAVPYLRKLDNLKISSNRIDIFKNDEYDVLKFNLDGKELHNMNAALKNNFEFTTSFPDFHPHCTIAYLKPGTGEKYVRDLSKPYILKPKSYKYSAPSGDKTYFTV